MSRIGKKPVPIPAGVKVHLTADLVRVEGTKGKLEFPIPEKIHVTQQDNQLICTRDSDTPSVRALHGLTRAMLNNMFAGVTTGFEKRLQIVGVGFNAKLQGKMLSLTVGYSKPIVKKIPDGVVVEVPEATRIIVKGIDKQKVGQFAAEVRAVRKPEPYKQTGIRYDGEVVRKKAGKAFGSAS